MRAYSRGLAGASALLLSVMFLTTAGISGSGAVTTAADPDLTAVGLQPSSRIDGFKSDTAALAKSSPGLLRRSDATPVRVMIKLDQDSLASYKGGVGDLASTSPAVTGHDLDLASSAAKAYTSYLAANERSFSTSLAKVAPGAKVTRSYRLVYGGVAAVVPANKVRAILGIDGVVAVQRDSMRKLLTDASAAFLNAGPVYSALGGKANAGQGVIYGNLDGGVWPEHPSFADQGNLAAPPPPARECNFGDNPLTPATDVFACQKKLIGGAHFTDTYDAIEGDDVYRALPVTVGVTARTPRRRRPGTRWPAPRSSASTEDHSPESRLAPG